VNKRGRHARSRMSANLIAGERSAT
jgi:hypothetical protein